jgi:hypothetical protein
LEAASKIVKGTEHVFDIPRNIYGGMKENYEEFKEDMRERLPEELVEFGDSINAVGEKTYEGMKAIGENTKEGIKNFGEKTVEGMKTFGENTKQMFTGKDKDKKDEE